MFSAVNLLYKFMFTKNRFVVNTRYENIAEISSNSKALGCYLELSQEKFQDNIFEQCEMVTISKIPRYFPSFYFSRN